jgi:hypothetical protein
METDRRPADHHWVVLIRSGDTPSRPPEGPEGARLSGRAGGRTSRSFRDPGRRAVYGAHLLFSAMPNKGTFSLKSASDIRDFVEKVFAYKTRRLSIAKWSLVTTMLVMISGLVLTALDIPYPLPGTTSPALPTDCHTDAAARSRQCAEFLETSMAAIIDPLVDLHCAQKFYSLRASMRLAFKRSRTPPARPRDRSTPFREQRCIRGRNHRAAFAAKQGDRNPERCLARRRAAATPPLFRDVD